MRLLKNGSFTHRPYIETVREEYLRKAEPVKAWVDARCDISLEQYQEGVDKLRLHTDFVEYCNRKKLPAVDVAHLGRKLKELYSVAGVKVGPKDNQKRVWKGIMLRKDLRATGELGLDEPDELEEEE